MRSSYFPQGAEESELHSESAYIKKICPPSVPTNSSSQRGSTLYPSTHNHDVQHSSALPTHSLNDGLVHFPSNTQILWDRTALAPPIYITPVDALPNLVLGSREVRKLLSLMDRHPLPNNHAAADLFNANAYVYHSSNLPKSHQELVQFLSRGMVTDKSDYCLSFERHQIEDLQLTIPISRGNSQQNPISILEDSLWRSISSCRDFGIKHFMRIRAHGALTVDESFNTRFMEADNATNKAGKMRFEALLPDITLQILPIHPLPILVTAMSSAVFDTLNKATHMASAMHSMTPNRRVDARFATLEASNMGYLTLNQTRKVVLLSESDVSLSSAPIVGVWVRLATSTAENAHIYDLDWKQLARHPYCWSACVRFLYHSRIGHRMCVAKDTFLLGLLVGDSTYFCEVTATVGNSGASVLTSDNLPAAISFLHLDFTASLSAENDMDMGRSDEQLGGLICRFKPVQTTLLASPSRRQQQSQAQFPSHIEVPSPTSSPQRFNLLSPSPAKPKPYVAAASSPIVATNILANATVDRTAKGPMEVPQGTYTFLQSARKSEMHEQQQLPTLPQHSSSANCHDAPSSLGARPIGSKTVSSGMCRSEESLQYSFPVQVITTQQQQIQQLQEEVASLKEMIRAMTASTSAIVGPLMDSQSAIVGGRIGFVDNEKEKSSSSKNDDMSLLFDSFQRQVINVLRASHESDRNRDVNSSPIPFLPGTDSEQLSYGTSNTNIGDSRFASKEKEGYVTAIRDGYESHLDDNDDDDFISNNRDYDEGEVQLYTRRNFRPNYMTSLSRAPLSAAASDDISTSRTPSNLSERSSSKSPLQDVPKKRTIPKGKETTDPSSTVKSSTRSAGANALSSEALSDKRISRDKFPTPKNEVDEVAATDTYDKKHGDMDDDTIEDEILIHGSSGGTAVRFALPPERTKPLSSRCKITNASGKTDASRWENSEKSFRESESILAIESKYR